MTSTRPPRIPPEDLRLYSLALNNKWTKKELYHNITTETPFFVYDSLMLPWVLAVVLNLGMTTAGFEEAAKHTTRATLRRHFRVTIGVDQTPTVVKSRSEVAVDGMLVARLTPEMAVRIDEYTASGQLRKSLQEVEVEIESSEGDMMLVCAYVYVWNADMRLLEAKGWTPLEYMKSGAA
ncbi:hypothetical protein P280DRAFT_512597 [Massarina eburnea CBS 473.64]|uniref:Gamma-glutamylcyclotransferase AIG2-like domain-containing protein n=1 Tax=Massarina eburnea CBS 473.64 TaxID=1395130 RepID=A0A6A6SIB6_9PLEO|nr:hypothetical protein P280DRAFT_512597 [Massarina eburnea CBS 473.64]